MANDNIDNSGTFTMTKPAFGKARVLLKHRKLTVDVGSFV
jgi:hypothetical protein